MSILNRNESNGINVTTLDEVAPHSHNAGLMEELSSLGEQLGHFKAYDAQLPITEIAGTRIVKCLYREKDGVRANENAYVRIGTKHLSEEVIVSRIKELAPYVLGWLQGLEDTAIKAKHKAGQLNIYPDSLSLDAIIETLEASESGARLTKEKIGLWFDEAISGALAELFAAKLGLDATSSDLELVKLEQVLAAYKSKFESLAGGKTMIAEKECKLMMDVIKKCDTMETIIGARFITRLERMSAPQEDLLLAL